MRNIRNMRGRRSRPTEINMAPLIDMVFILLIFFLVTTSFVREAGVEVRRPVAETARTEQKVNLFIGLTAEGQPYIEGSPVDVRMIRARVERFLAENPGGKVMVLADERSQTGPVIKVVDQCRLAGIEDVGIAARRPEP